MRTTFANNDTPTGEIRAAVNEDAPDDHAHSDDAPGSKRRTASVDQRSMPVSQASGLKDEAAAMPVRAPELPFASLAAAHDGSMTEVTAAGGAVIEQAAGGVTPAVATAYSPAPVAAAPVGVSPPAKVPKTTVRARRSVRGDLLAYGAFLLLAVWVTSSLWPVGGHRISSVDANDQAFFEWMLSHGARVVTHLDSPLFTDRMNMPAGVNLMANTSILALSIPLAPITLWLGPAVSYALLLTLGLAGTASAWYFVLSRHVVTSRSAAFVGAALAGFGPGIVAHANGHPNIVSQFLVPFIAWRVVRLREKRRWLRNGIALGLLVSAQVFINEEMLFIVAMALGILLAAYAIMRWSEVRPHLRSFFAGLGVTSLVTGSLIAYPLWRQFFGPQAYRGLDPGVQGFGSDVAAFAAFGTRTILGEFTNNAHLATSQSEQNSFFGWPLLISAVVALFWLRRSALARALGIAALSLLILSLGPVIAFDGHRTHIPAPWTFVKNVPIFSSVVPTRLSLFVLPIIAVLVALTHDRVLRTTTRTENVKMYADPRVAERARQSRLAWYALVGVSLIAAIPTPVPTVPLAAPPAFIAAGTWKDFVTPDQTVVPVPLPRAGAVQSMIWAADSGLAVRLPAGYFLGPDASPDKTAIFGAPDRRTTVLLNKVIMTNKPVVVKPADRKAAIADLRYWRAAVVIQLPSGPSQHAVRQTLSDLLGFKPKYSGGVWVWDVRRLVGQEPALSG